MSPGPVAQLERTSFFLKTLWKRNLFLVLALLLDVLVLAFVACLHVDTEPRAGSAYLLGYHVYLALDHPNSYFWFAVILFVQVWLGHRALLGSLKGEGMIPLYPEDESGGRTFAGFTGQQLVDMVHEIARHMGVGPIRRVVLADRPDPNAYTAHILGLGNVVVLHSNLLDILPPEGVRAIVAHEVGHVRRRDSILYLFTSLPRSFLTLIGAVILWKIGVGIFWFESIGVLCQRVIFLAVVWTASMWILARLERLANLASQQSEHLADAYAAATVGWGATMNALLLLGERSEALYALARALGKLPHLQDVRWTEEELLPVLRRLPARELDDERASQLASRLYIESRLAALKNDLCVPLSEEEIADLAARADRALKSRQTEQKEEKDQEEREEKKKEVELEKLLIDWRKYDRDRSGHLDAMETAVLVGELRKHPEKMIFRQFLEPDAEWESHPTMRHRLLYLYEAFHEMQPS